MHKDACSFIPYLNNYTQNKCDFEAFYFFTPSMYRLFKAESFMSPSPHVSFKWPACSGHHYIIRLQYRNNYYLPQGNDKPSDLLWQRTALLHFWALACLSKDLRGFVSVVFLMISVFVWVETSPATSPVKVNSVSSTIFYQPLGVGSQTLETTGINQVQAVKRLRTAVQRGRICLEQWKS